MDVTKWQTDIIADVRTMLPLSAKTFEWIILRFVHSHGNCVTTCNNCKFDNIMIFAIVFPITLNKKIDF